MVIKMKICITSSAGGHLTEALQIAKELKNHKIFFFTFYISHIKESLGDYSVYFNTNPRRNPLSYFRIILKSITILLKEKPDIIVSTGAGFTVPISILGKLVFRSKLIYTECSAQVFKPSLCGRILYPFADLFFVQWKYLLNYYGKKAQYGGLLI